MATFKDSLSYEVWVLDRESAEGLVRQAEDNDTLRFTDAAVNRILALTSCHPYLTQLLCQRIWERALSGRDAKAPQIDAPEVEDAVDDALEKGHHALVWLWGGLMPAEKVYAAALAEISTEGQMISQKEVDQVMHAHAARFRRREVELAPKGLVERKILILERSAEQGQEYRFAVEMMRRWVRANWPLRKVKEELDKLEPMAIPLYESGQNSFQQGNFEDAVQYFEAALERDSKHFGARLQLGEALLQLDDLDRAVTELDHAYSLDQEEARTSLISALLKRAEQRQKTGRRKEARADCERVLKISPDDQIAKEQRDTLLETHWEKADISKQRNRLSIGISIVMTLAVVATIALLIYNLHFRPREANLQNTVTAQAVSLATAEQKITQGQAAIATVTADARPIVPTQIPVSTATPFVPVELPTRIGTPLPQLTTAILPENAYLLTQVACWGRGTLNKVIYSPDGNLLAVASSQGLHLYDTLTLEETRFIDAGVWARSVAFSPDSECVALGLDDGTVVLWKTKDGALVMAE